MENLSNEYDQVDWAVIEGREKDEFFLNQLNQFVAVYIIDGLVYVAVSDDNRGNCGIAKFNCIDDTLLHGSSLYAPVLITINGKPLIMSYEEWDEMMQYKHLLPEYDVQILR